MMLDNKSYIDTYCYYNIAAIYFTTIFVAKKSQKYFAAQQKELGELSGHVEEMYTGHKIVKAFGHEKDSIENFDDINDRLYECRLESTVCFRDYVSSDEFCQ